MRKFTIIAICLLAFNTLWAQTVPVNWTITSLALTAAEGTTDVTDLSKSAIMNWTSTDTQKLRSDDFAVTEGSAYVITLDVLDNTNAGRTRIGIGWNGAAIDWNAFPDYSADQASFQTLTYSGTVPTATTTAYVEVRFYDETTGWATNGNQATNIIDNMTCKLDGGANLVANGSFETWGVASPDIWITFPTNGATVNTANVNVAFNVSSFVLNTDGKVKYTVDGGAAQFQTTTAPIALTGLTETSHTVIVELVDMAEASLSPAVTAQTTFTVNLSAPSYTPIYDIQYTTIPNGDSPLLGTTGTTKGVVSATFGDKFWIQDGAGAWNGLYVYYVTTPGPARGDSVMVSGTVAEYNNLTEITPVTNVTILNSGNTVAAPTVLTTGTVAAESYEGVLVRVTGICTNAAAGFGMWTITDGSGEILIDDNIYAYVPVVGNSYTVTGVVNVFTTEWKILPRDAADIIDNGASTTPLIVITAPLANSTVYANNVDVTFTVSNFVLGTTGKVAWNLDGGTDAYVTTNTINVGGLTAGLHTVNLQLVDMSNIDISPAVTASVSFTINLGAPTYTPIYDIQYTTNANGNSPVMNQVVWVRAVVSANFNGSTYGEGYYLQQGGGAWKGIYVSDLTRTPSIGDSVIICGTVKENFSMTQIESITSFSVVEIGGIVANPASITTFNANTEQYESCLVKVSNAECTVIQNEFGEWEVNDGTGALACKDNGAFSFTEILGTNYDITGVTLYSYSVYSLNYRIESDIQISAGIDTEFANSISVYPNPANDYLTVSLDEVANSISISNLVGQTIMEITPSSNNETINIESLEAGVYFVKVTKNTNSSIIKFVVE
jgi:hypothetical protein